MSQVPVEEEGLEKEEEAAVAADPEGKYARCEGRGAAKLFAIYVFSMSGLTSIQGIVKSCSEMLTCNALRLSFMQMNPSCKTRSVLAKRRST
jgi:hypothetical protein